MDDSEGIELIEDCFIFMMGDNLDYLFLIYGVIINEEVGMSDCI